MDFDRILLRLRGGKGSGAYPPTSVERSRGWM